MTSGAITNQVPAIRKQNPRIGVLIENNCSENIERCLMSEKNTVIITHEQPLTINLSDTACRVILKYEKPCDSQDTGSGGEGDPIQPGVWQVSRYAGKESGKEPAVKSDKKSESSFPLPQKTSNFDSDIQAPNTSIKKGRECDVFVSYNSKDFTKVSQIVEQLENKGINLWMDKKEMRGGDSSQGRIQNAIINAKCILIFIGSNILGKWQKIELRAAFKQYVEKRARLIPVLLPGVEEIPKEEEFLFLEDLHVIPFDGMDDEDALKQLISGITGVESPGKIKRR